MPRLVITDLDTGEIIAPAPAKRGGYRPRKPRRRAASRDVKDLLVGLAVLIAALAVIN